MSDLREGIQQLCKLLCSQGEPAQIYGLCNELLDNHPDNIQLLLYKSKAIQLLSEGSESLLQNARDCIQRILDLDPTYIPALVEMGWFVFVHDDDAKKASRYFLKALKVARNYTTDCLDSMSDCLKELRLKKGCGHKKA